MDIRDQAVKDESDRIVELGSVLLLHKAAATAARKRAKKRTARAR